MSHGKKVERISRLARWRVGRLDTLESWLISKEQLYCYSDSFKIGINWVLYIVKRRDNQQADIMLCMEESQEQPLTARFVLRVFHTEPGHCPYTSPVYEREFGHRTFMFPDKYTPHGPTIIDIEFLDLKISPLSGREESLATKYTPHEEVMRSLATKTTISCLSRMLKEEILTDVTINTPDGVLKAHRAVLSAGSPVFESMFLHDLKEKETSTINIEDISLEACMALLCFMYGTLKQEEFWNQRTSLLIAADKYGMINLKNYCEESLLEDVNFSNVFERLQEAWIYKLDKLKNMCFRYLFEFGMIHQVKNEISSFFRHADRELMLEMFQQTITTEWCTSASKFA